MSLTRITSAGHAEPHGDGMAARLNWLRAAVLGANDGIVSTAGLVVGVAGATASRTAILTAGLAGLFAGALAMASGEYVSVSSQRDAEKAMLALERRELAGSPQAEAVELARIYQSKGLQPRLARQVAEQLTAHDALAAHAEAGPDHEQREEQRPVGGVHADLGVPDGAGQRQEDPDRDYPRRPEHAVRGRARHWPPRSPPGRRARRRRSPRSAPPRAPA